MRGSYLAGVFNVSWLFSHNIFREIACPSYDRYMPPPSKESVVSGDPKIAGE